MKKRITLIILALALTFTLIGCSAGGGGSKITIGSKNFTENIILAHLMADIIEEKTDLTVERKVNLGGSSIAWEALHNDEIQLYPDYTGTLVANYYQEETGTSQETRERAVELAAEDDLVLDRKSVV